MSARIGSPSDVADATVRAYTVSARTTKVRGVALVLLTLVAACGGRPVAADDVPPAGSMWFGSSFDTTTFAMTGRTTTIRFGSQVAYVAHLTRPSTGESFVLSLDIGGLPATWPGGQLEPGDEIMGQVLPAAEIYQPGPLTVRVVDAGGTTLAEGTVTITP